MSGRDLDQTPEERFVSSLWADVLGVEEVRPSENYWQSFSFLDVAALAAEAGVPIRGAQLTRNRTVETLAVDLAAERLVAERRDGGGEAG